MLVKHMPFKYEYKIQIPRKHVSQTHNVCSPIHMQAFIRTPQTKHILDFI